LAVVSKTIFDERIYMLSTAHYAVFQKQLGEIEKSLRDDHLAQAFHQCFLNTLQTTVESLEDGTTFVFTGDIPAMWLRDSSAQVRPYVRFAHADTDLQRLIRGLIRRQAMYINIDPYANAFNKTANGQGHQADKTANGPWLWERKYELDSLCYPVQLLKHYWDVTHEASVFDEAVHQMLRCVVQVIRREQRHDQDSLYSFERTSGAPSDTLPLAGRGTRTKSTGMSWSGFRPSDDACKFGYLIPANMFAVVILNDVAEFALKFYDDAPLAAEANALRQEINFGIQTYGLVDHPKYGRMYAYETDGFGNYTLMDDANVPSLLSIPYLGYRPAADPIYQNTRAFVLSRDNPCYFEGTQARGIGSPHTTPGFVWPISLIMQALTAVDSAEKDALLMMLLNTTAGTNYMHESFDPSQPDRFSRPWFAWANSLFGEFVIDWANGETSR